ncbi:MAG: A24 family peptidase [Actinomycetota bacterium]
MILIVSLALVGLAFGPLLAVVVDRAVERRRLEPEHRCVHCHTALGPSSLIPVVGWFGRCGGCGRHKGWRYPLVDVLSAATFASLGLAFGWTWALGPYLVLAAVLVVLSVIDIETHLLPNIIVWPAIGVGLFTVLTISGERSDAEAVYSALTGAAVFGGFIGAAHVAHEAGMGRGDVKLAALLGLFVGWLQPGPLAATRATLYALLIALIAGGLVGLAVNIARRRRGAEIPFGPALAAAALLVVVVGPTPS